MPLGNGQGHDEGIRSRGGNQQPWRHRRNRLAAGVGMQSDPRPSGHGFSHNALQKTRHEADRRRSHQHRIRSIGRHSPEASPRHKRGALPRLVPHHPTGRDGGIRGMDGNAHRESRSIQADDRGDDAGTMLRTHHHPNRDAGSRGPLVCIGGFRHERSRVGDDGAQPRQRRRDGLGQLGPIDGQRGQTGDRDQSLARTKQRAGLLRHGRSAQRLHELPIHGRRRTTGKGLRRMERASAYQTGHDLPENASRRQRWQRPQHVHDRFGHRPHRPEQRIRQGCLGQARVAHRTGYFHDRVREAGPRHPAGRNLSRIQRHLHQRRTPHPANPQGHRTTRSSEGRLANCRRTCRGDGTPHRFLPGRFRHLG